MERDFEKRQELFKKYKVFDETLPHYTRPFHRVWIKPTRRRANGWRVFEYGVFAEDDTQILLGQGCDHMVLGGHNTWIPEYGLNFDILDSGEIRIWSNVNDSRSCLRIRFRYVGCSSVSMEVVNVR